MIAFLALFLGCATAPPERLRSTPAEPTVELGKPEPSVTWATLEGFLVQGDVALPPALTGLALGQAEADARAAFVKVKHQSLLAPDDRVHEGTTVVSGRLQDFPEVGVSLLIRAGELAELDLSLPADEALFVLTQAWGQPQESITADVVVPQPVWRGPGVRATLIATDEGPAILKFTRLES